MSNGDFMKPLYKILSVMICIFILISLTGCDSGSNAAIVYFELDKKPDTLDAQLASSDQELMIVRNIYEGLMRENSEGKIVNGACESYEKNGLVYTFKLRKDAAWSTGVPLTADDFVFAFRRAVDKKTDAPFAKRLFKIQNAQKIHKGQAATDSLGVKALDDRTLEITLIAEDDDFEKTLTTSICMPCNEDFFNQCHGQYGLKSSYIISNGSYSITKWNREDFGIRIYRNSSYNGDFKAKNGAVFFSLEEDTTPAERLISNKVDIAFINNESVEKFNNEDFTQLSYENICWFLTIGNQYNGNLRKAFSMLTASSVYSTKLSVGFRAADSMFPSSLSIEENLNSVGFSEYNTSDALSIFSQEVIKYEDKKFPSSTLTYYDNPAIKPAVTAIVGHWQQSVSAFINISAYKENSDLSPQLTSQTLPMAVFYIKASSGYIDEYLENFGFDYVGQNLANVQTELLRNRSIIPIAFENTNIIYSRALKNVYSSNSNGYVDFSFITKKD